MKLAKLNGKAEVFGSFQGEGVTAGTPSVFVRLSLCNLHCVWCDTDYTWNWEGTPFAHVGDGDASYRKFRKAEQIIELSPIEVRDAVLAHSERNVVLTGGEPMLQQEDLAEVMHLLRGKDRVFRFEVETNGTIVPTSGFDGLIDQYNVSPKLENSGVKASLRLRDEALAWFSGSEKAWFKFVLGAREDLEEVRDVVSAARLPADRILLMPLGTTPEDLDRRIEWLGPACEALGWRLADRRHVRVFGARRGV